MRGGLDRLQKEIDTLTYNSRTVLNALIRSTVSSGSSRGYTITKAGQELTLTRVDIYRLYKFYQEWENNDFAQSTIEATATQRRLAGFDEIRVAQDAIPVVDENGNQNTSSTTNALITHGKVLFLTEANLDQINDTVDVNNYWLGLIRTSNNAKLISNSSPVPINLRTPVFDENLATTKYSQHETYLFPTAYYILDMLGYYGDGVDHTMGGNSWTIDVNDRVIINGQGLAFGDVDDSDTRKTQARRNGNRDANGNLLDTGRMNNFAWGFDTHARAKYSTAGGFSSMVADGAIASIAIGYDNITTNPYSAAIGGALNSVSGQYSGIVSGQGNVVTADYSGVFAGLNNIVGGKVFNFTFPFTNATSQNCVIDETACTATVVSGGSASVTGRNSIVIEGNYVTEFGIGDKVRLFDYTTTYENLAGIEYYETNGDFYQSQNLTVTAVALINSNTQTQITLSDDVAGSGIVDGGKISRTYIEGSTPVNVGYASFAAGQGLIAEGSYQAVVGRFNYRQTDPTLRFVVGSGTSDTTRLNSVEVFDDRTVIYGTPRSSTVSEPAWGQLLDTTGFIGFNVSDTLIEAIVNDSHFKMQGAFSALIHNVGQNDEYGLRINNGDISITSNDQNSTVGYITVNANSQLISYFSGWGSPTLGGLGLFAEGDLFAGASYIHIKSVENNAYTTIESSNNVNLIWGNILSLSGDTFTALPTNDSQFAHRISSGNYDNYIDDSNYIGIRSGFYYKTGYVLVDSQNVADFRNPWTATDLINMGADTSLANDVNGILQILSSTQTTITNGTQTDYFSLSMPSIGFDPNNIGKVAVNRASITDTLAGVTGTFKSTKLLAWDEDVQEMGKWYDGRAYISKIYPSEDSSDIQDTDVVSVLRYTKINNTIIVNLMIRLFRLDTDFDSNQLVIEFTGNTPLGDVTIDDDNRMYGWSVPIGSTNLYSLNSKYTVHFADGKLVIQKYAITNIDASAETITTTRANITYIGSIAKFSLIQEIE